MQERTTDLSKVNEALRQAGAYDRSLIEASLDPLVTIGPDGRITDVNRATGKCPAAPATELIGADFSVYFTEPERANAGYRKVFQEGLVQDYPLESPAQGRPLNGRAVQRHGLPRRRGAKGDRRLGRPRPGTMTELRAAVETLEAERQRFNDVLETLPAYVVLLTPDYHVSFANRFFRERFGESQGKRCFEYLFDRTEPCEICEARTRSSKTNTPRAGSGPARTAAIYDIYDFPFTDADGSPLIMEMGIDITDRKHAEAALKEANETLEQHVAGTYGGAAGGERAASRTDRGTPGRAGGIECTGGEARAQAEELHKSEQRLRMALEGGRMGLLGMGHRA